jgi:hypothetical protein
MKCLSLLALLLTLTSCQNPSRPLPLDSLVDCSFIEDGGLTSYGADLIFIAALRPMLIASLKARRRAICRCSNPPSTSLSSI